jgi:hypothetical protein
MIARPFNRQRCARGVVGAARGEPADLSGNTGEIRQAASWKRNPKWGPAHVSASRKNGNEWDANRPTTEDEESRGKYQSWANRATAVVSARRRGRDGRDKAGGLSPRR